MKQHNQMMNLKGVGVAANIEEAVKLFKKSADLGNPDSMSYYAEYRFYGVGIEINIKESFEYFHKSISNRSYRGMLVFASILSEFDNEAMNQLAIRYLKIILNHGNKLIENKKGIANINKGTYDLNIYKQALYLHCVLNNINIRYHYESLCFLNSTI